MGYGKVEEETRNINFICLVEGKQKKKMIEKNSLYKFFAIISLLRSFFFFFNYYIRKNFLLSIKLVNITFYKILEL